MILDWCWNSFCLALVSAVGAMLIGLGLSQCWISWKRRGGVLFGFFESLSILPFILSGTLVSTALLIRWRQFDLELGWWPIILCHWLMNSMWVSSKISEDWLRLPENSVSVARSLGSSRWIAVWQSFIVPLSNRFKVTFLTVFLFSFTSFAPVLILGGGPPVATLETEIFAAIRLSGLQWEQVGGLIAVQTLVLLLVSLGLVPANKNQGHPGGSESGPVQRNTQWSEWIFLVIWGVFFGLVVWILAPVMGLPRELSVGLIPAWDTFRLSILSASALLVVTFVLRSRLKGILLGALSPMSVAAFLFFAVARFLDVISGSWFWIVVCQCLLFLPFSLRSVSSVVGERLLSELQWAQSCGAGRFLRLRRIWLPAIGSEVARLFGILMVFSMGDLVSVSLFAGEDSRFLVLEMARASGRMEIGLSMELGKWWMMLAVLVLVATGQRLRKL